MVLHHSSMLKHPREPDEAERNMLPPGPPLATPIKGTTLRSLMVAYALALPCKALQARRSRFLKYAYPGTLRVGDLEEQPGPTGELLLSRGC
jgi:hypothetical protein